MKFLCVSCDEPMKLTDTAAAGGGGSLSVLYQCPACSQQIAMLTNPWETEMVQSLGVKIGPQEDAGDEKAASGGCPFAAMVGEAEREKVVEEPSPEDGLSWTTGALERLEKIPGFVRPMAKQGVEHYAKSQGRTLVDEDILGEARSRFGM